MDIQGQFLQRRFARMTKAREEIEEERRRLMHAVDKVQPHLENLKNKKDYIGYILLGTALVERQVITTVKAHIHAFNLLALMNDISTAKGFPYHFTPPLPKKMTSGQAMKLLSKTFDFNNNHSKLYEKTDELITLRNNLSHRLVDQFKGDIDLANKEIEPLAEKQIVESVFGSFRTLLDTLSKDLKDRFIITKNNFENVAQPKES